jgi:hypothetical protein
MKYLKRFDESNYFNIKDKYKAGDNIDFVYDFYDRKENKTRPIKISGTIEEIENYTEKTWGTLNVKVKPNADILTDKDGFIWIAQTSIIE